MVGDIKTTGESSWWIRFNVFSLMIYIYMFYSDPKRLDLMIQFDDPASFASLETGEKKIQAFQR